MRSGSPAATRPAAVNSTPLHTRLIPRQARTPSAQAPRRGKREAPVRGHSHDWFPAAPSAGGRPRRIAARKEARRRKPGPETDPGLTPSPARGCAVGAISHAIPRHCVRHGLRAPAAKAANTPLIAATGGRRGHPLNPLATPRPAPARSGPQEVVRPSRSFPEATKNSPRACVQWHGRPVREQNGPAAGGSQT